jgi:hypothetical protein
MLRKLLLLVIFTMITSLFLFASAGTQKEEKQTFIVVQQFPAWNKVPIEITGVKVKGQEIEKGKPFYASDEWIQYLSVVVKNVSEVDLAGVSATVEFARSAEDAPLLPDVQIWAGKDYSFSQKPPGKDLALKPGDSIEVSVSAASYKALKYELKQRAGLLDGILRRVIISPIMAAFSQDRVWLRGHYMIRDVQDSNRWLPDPAKNNNLMSRAKQVAVSPLSK